MRFAKVSATATVALLLPFVCLEASWAEPLTVSIPITESDRIEGDYTQSGLSVQLVYWDVTGTLPDENTRIFDTFALLPEDAGATVRISSVDDDEDFAAFVVRLTNGADDHIEFQFLTEGGGPAGKGRESLLFSDEQLVPGRIGPSSVSLQPDLDGYHIQSVSIEIIDLTMEIDPDPYPVPCQTCTRWSFRGTLLIEAAPIDSTPRPPTLFD